MVIREMRMEDLDQVVLLYCECFAEAPWFEEFDTTEVTTEFAETLSWPDAVVLVCELEGRILGGVIGFALKRKPDVKELVDAERAFYFAEAFVSKESRRKGVYSALLQARSKKARLLGFEFGVVRTSVAQSITQHMFLEKLGYKIVAEQNVMSTKVIDRIQCNVPDKRVVMLGKI